MGGAAVSMNEAGDVQIAVGADTTTSALPLSISSIVSPPVFEVCGFMEVLGRVMMDDEKRPALISGIVERS